MSKKIKHQDDDGCYLYINSLHAASAAVTIGALKVNAFFIVVCGDKDILLLDKYCKNLQVC